MYAKSLLFLFLLIFSCNGAQTKIGILIDTTTRIGREQKIAIQLSARDHLNLNAASLRFRNYTSRNPGSLLRAAEALIGEESPDAIVVGSESSEDAVLLSSVLAVRTPVVSLATAKNGGSPPFLVQMAAELRQQIPCVASLVRSYNWRRVVVVYQEDGLLGSDSYRELNLLSEALQKVGAEIEHSVALPPLFSSSETEDELKKVVDWVQSRVFVVLRLSLPTAVSFFREAKKVGLVGRDTAWILTEGVADYLEFFDSSVLSSIEGAIGIKGHHQNNNVTKQFMDRFGPEFRVSYSDEHYTEPSFYALRAYDGINTIGLAVKRMAGANDSSSPEINFVIVGLIGRIKFKDGGLHDGNNYMLSIVNVVGNGYKNLYSWTPAMIKNKTNDEESNLKLEGVTWPGNMMNREPKGWKMPTETKPMIIGVPGRTSFEKFVKVVNESENKKRYDGFCIDLFDMVLGALEYDLPYNFEAYNGTYEELIDLVYNKTYDAVVGDMTITSSRSDKVEFTQPFMESGLSMIVPANSERSAWMFLKPFTPKMWLVTGAILIYTMFIIWFFEHRTSPEYNGPLRSQMGTAIHFTFSSLFFAHREKVYSNLTRVVLTVWLFVVLILNSSYTANLSSMLTVLRLKPNIVDIDSLIKNNLKIGCDGDSFVKDYLQKVLHFKSDNIESVDSEYKYEGKFDTNNISAAFLEIPYQRVFINHYCKRFTATPQTFRFGGFGFVFQKGSPLAADVSKAILKLSEDGELKKLEEQWFATPRECLDIESDHATGSLSLQNFWGLYVITGATSTLCLMVFLVKLLKKCKFSQEEGTIWEKTIELAKYIYNGKDYEERGSLSTAPGVEEWSSSRSSWVCESPDPQIPEDPRIPGPAAV
ncbi:Glutamate receptor 2.7 [Linum perenne]